MAHRMLMALRAPRPESAPESEPVEIDTDDPTVVRITLDDGETLEFDAVELRSTLSDQEAA